jgi:3-oxoacyl-[acyl-carrier-protein] synthase III
MSNEVYITKLAKFLPNKPISNDEMEDYLGMIDNQPSKARRIVLRNNGIKTRYYAIDKEGNSTHSNAEITAIAIEKLFDERFTRNDIELLACGTTSPDQILPSHTSMIHGCLNIPSIELASFQGSCCSGIQALKFCYLSVLAGNTTNAVCAGSEHLSKWMLSKNFENESKKIRLLEANPMIAFEKEFLRWMLSDGAGAALLESQPYGEQSLKIEWIDIRSYANQLETCMYAGSEKDCDGKLLGWTEFEAEDWLHKSIFSLKQDTRLLGENIVKMGGLFLKDIRAKRNFDLDTIDYFLPHISSEYFRGKILENFEELGYDIPAHKWFTNLSSVGNIGAGSSFIMLEELFNSGQLKKGQKLLLMVPESARFSYAFALLTVC